MAKADLGPNMMEIPVQQTAATNNASDTGTPSARRAGEKAVRIGRQ